MADLVLLVNQFDVLIYQHPALRGVELEPFEDLQLRGIDLGDAGATAAGVGSAERGMHQASRHTHTHVFL